MTTFHYRFPLLVFSEQTSGDRDQTRALRRCGCGCCGRGTLPLPRIDRTGPSSSSSSSSAARRLQFPDAPGSGDRPQLPTPVERSRQQQTDGVLEDNCSSLYFSLSLHTLSLYPRARMLVSEFCT